MKTYDKDVQDDMLDEYDFSHAERGTFAESHAQYRLVSEPSTAAENRAGRIAFQEQAQRILSDYYGLDLAPATVPHIHRRFDLVSPDQDIVGNARYYSKSASTHLATITENVWLLEKTSASSKFLVFGNDAQAPLVWLNAYGNLLTNIAFYFLRDGNHLIRLTGPQTEVRRPKNRVAGLNSETISAGADFDEPFPDDFWTGIS